MIEVAHFGRVQFRATGFVGRDDDEATDFFVEFGANIATYIVEGANVFGA